MPAYTSISFLFEKPVPNKIVERFYRTFMSEGIKFKSVMAWGCSANMTLKEIIDWNQSKIDENFILGMDTDVSFDTRQIYLDVEPFSECRVYLLNDETILRFVCIVPECEITSKNSAVFEKAALRIWENLPVKSVVTYPEIDSLIEPSVELFAIVDENTAKLPSSTYYLQEPVIRGVILKPNERLKEPVIFLETKRISKNIQHLLSLQPAKIGKSLNKTTPKNVEDIICDYISQSELSMAIEYLVNIVEETNIKLSLHDFEQLSRIASYVGLDFPTEG